MEYIVLKKSDLKVSRLCIGGCPMGEYGWGKTEKNHLLRAIDTAMDKGINFFDTADVYGLGKSEENYGDALAGKRSKAIVATKFGVRIENGKTFYDNSPQWIEQALTGSLKRLKTDYIDLYQIHYWDKKTPLNVIVEELERWKKKGCIRFYGFSNISGKETGELTRVKDKFVSFQNEYSLACRENEKDMQFLSEELELSPLTWGSLGQGVLTGKYGKDMVFDQNDRRSREVYVNFHGQRLEKNLQIVETMKHIAEIHNTTVAAVAVRWILDYLKGSVVLTGVKNEQQVLANADALGWHLDIEEIEALEKISAYEEERRADK